MNNENGFDLLIADVLAMSTQLGGTGTKSQDLMISFFPGEGDNIPQLHLRAIQIKGEIIP